MSQSRRSREQGPNALHQRAGAQYRQIDTWIILGTIGFEWFSAHAEGSLKAVGRKPSGEGSSVVFHARTLRKPLDIYAHRAACAAPLSFADYKEMQLHRCPDLTVLVSRLSLRSSGQPLAR